MSQSFADNIDFVATSLVFVGWPVQMKLFLSGPVIVVDCSSLELCLEKWMRVAPWMDIVFSNKSCIMTKVFLFASVTLYGLCLQGNNLLYILRWNVPQPSEIGETYIERRSRPVKSPGYCGNVGHIPSCIGFAPVVSFFRPFGDDL